MALEIRRDIYEKHASLFGEKTVSGKKVNGEELITKLTREDMLPKIGYVAAGLGQVIKRQREGWAYITG